MIKLNAGFSRKVGEPNYGSRGASVNVELELESGLIGDPDGLRSKINNLFDIARRSVDAELAGGPIANGHSDSGNPVVSRTSFGVPGNSYGNGRTDNHGGNGQPTVRYATVSQIRAIRAICQRQGLDPERFANQRYRVNGIEELSVKEASAIIDELKAATSRNGGGR